MINPDNLGHLLNDVLQVKLLFDLSLLRTHLSSVGFLIRKKMKEMLHQDFASLINIIIVKELVHRVSNFLLRHTV